MSCKLSVKQSFIDRPTVLAAHLACINGHGQTGVAKADNCGYRKVGILQKVMNNNRRELRGWLIFRSFSDVAFLSKPRLCPVLSQRVARKRDDLTAPADDVT